MRAQLEKMFASAFNQFLGTERDNILKGTSEPNLCGRLAMALEVERTKARLSGYVVDTEYNRNGGKLKTIMDDKAQVVTIRCDVIVHSRGRIPEQDNLIAIEMKRVNHPGEEKEKDRIRLKAMTKASFDDVWSADGKTLPEHVCGYVVGYYLELNAAAERFLVEEYAGGKLVASREVSF